MSDADEAESLQTLGLTVLGKHGCPSKRKKEKMTKPYQVKV
jgi:hypothetical protein